MTGTCTRCGKPPGNNFAGTPDGLLCWECYQPNAKLRADRDRLLAALKLLMGGIDPEWEKSINGRTTMEIVDEAISLAEKE